MWSDKYIGRLVCHTGHAYSNTGLITLTYTLSKSQRLYLMRRYSVVSNYYKCTTRICDGQYRQYNQPVTIR